MLVGIAPFELAEALLPGEERLALFAQRSILGRECKHAGQVDADDHARMLGGEADGDRRADVLPLGAEARVAQALAHQARPDVRHAARGDKAGAGRASREGVAGEGVHDHIEAIVLVTSVRSRISQERNELQQFDV